MESLFVSSKMLLISAQTRRILRPNPAVIAFRRTAVLLVVIDYLFDVVLAFAGVWVVAWKGTLGNALLVALIVAALVSFVPYPSTKPIG